MPVRGSASRRPRERAAGKTGKAGEVRLSGLCRCRSGIVREKDSNQALIGVAIVYVSPLGAKKVYIEKTTG